MFADDICLIPKDLADLQQMVKVVEEFSKSHGQSFGYKKTSLLLFRPDKSITKDNTQPGNPHAGNLPYPTPTELQITLSTLTENDQHNVIYHKDEEGNLLESAMYLGMLLHVSLSWKAHLNKVVIPIVANRMEKLRSSLVNADITSPKIGIQMIDTFIASCSRYGAEVFGVSPWQRHTSECKEEFKRIDEIFTRAYIHLLDLQFERPNHTAIRYEVGFTGINGIMASSLCRLLHDCLRMPDNRIPRAVMLRSLDRLKLRSAENHPIRGEQPLPTQGGHFSIVAASCLDIRRKFTEHQQNRSMKTTGEHTKQAQCRPSKKYVPREGDEYAFRDNHSDTPMSKGTVKAHIQPGLREMIAREYQSNIELTRPDQAPHSAAPYFCAEFANSSIPPHLVNMICTSKSSWSSPIVISRWRTATIATGSQVDKITGVHGTQGPTGIHFSPKCSKCKVFISDTPTHSLLACTHPHTAEIFRCYGKKLLQAMQNNATWLSEYNKSSLDGRTKLILNAVEFVDTEHIEEQKKITNILTEWLTTIQLNHPLMKQRTNGKGWEEIQEFKSKRKPPKPKSSVYRGVTKTKAGTTTKWVTRLQTKWYNKAETCHSELEAATRYDKLVRNHVPESFQNNYLNFDREGNRIERRPASITDDKARNNHGNRTDDKYIYTLPGSIPPITASKDIRDLFNKHDAHFSDPNHVWKIPPTPPQEAIVWAA